MDSLDEFVFIAALAFIVLDVIALEVVILLKHRKQKEFAIANEQLRNQLDKQKNAEEHLDHQRIELTTANKELRCQASELERAQNELQEARRRLEQSPAELSDELHDVAEQERVGKRLRQ